MKVSLSHGSELTPLLLTFLICLLILLLPVPQVGGAAPWYWTLGGVTLLNALYVGACWAGAWRAGKLAARGGRLDRLRAVRLFGLLNVVIVCLVAAQVYPLGWVQLVEHLSERLPWLLGAGVLVLLTPLLLMAVAALIFRYRFEREHGQMRLSLVRYLSLRFRVEVAIILVPLVVLAVVSDLSDNLWAGSGHKGAIDAGVSVAFVLGVLLLGPSVLKVLWRARSLPAGPLRTRLEALARSLKFRCSDILVWHTYGFMANACVIGFLPRVRYVMMTDALLAHLEEDEIEAVFAHEVGHARRHHFAFYLLFALAFTCFYLNGLDLMRWAGLEAAPGERLAGGQGLAEAVAMVVLAVAYWWLVFGWLSRRHELQADVFALRSCRRPEAFIDALDRLTLLTGAPRQAGSWRHFSVARRKAFLSRVLKAPELGRRLDRSLGRLQAMVAVLLIVGGMRLLLFHPELLGL